MVGTVTVVTAKSRDQRFNNVKATYYDPTAYAQEVDSLPIWSLTYYIQDGAELPQKVLSLPMVNNEFLAQTDQLQNADSGP